MSYRKLIRIAWLIVFTLGGISQALVFPQNAQAQTAKTSCVIQSPSITAWPNVSVTFRVVDGLYRSVTDLTPTDFNIQDNNVPATLRSAKSDPNGIGLNMYLVIDQGNRTDERVVRQVLSRFGQKYMLENLDRVTIVSSKPYPDRSNPKIYLSPTSSVTKYLEAVQNLSEGASNPLSGLSAIQTAIDLARSESLGCSRPSFILAVTGEDVASHPSIATLTAGAQEAHIPVFIVHIPRNGEYGGANQYQELAQATNGQYYQMPYQQTEEFTSLDISLFQKLIPDRTTYQVDYRTQQGSNGEHSITISYKGQALPATTGGSPRYTATVSAPALNITAPLADRVIERNARYSEMPVYDIDLQSVQVEVAWPDGYPRDLKSVTLVLTTEGGEERIPQAVPGDSSAIKFDWDMSRFSTAGEKTAQLRVDVSDEFDYTAASQQVKVTIRNTIGERPTVIPTEITGKIEIIEKGNARNEIVIYVLAGVVAVLLLLIVVLNRQLKKLAAGGLVGKVVEAVRKTIVGGARRGTPLATLTVLEGPTNMIGQQLKVYTEVVKLGRDPSKSDFTFYADANSSISGLHCKIERINGGWRVAALSQSGQETFVDGSPISFDAPYPLSNGQTVRMGYPAQQPVELRFELAAQGQAPASKPKRQTEVDTRPTARIGLSEEDKKGLLKDQPADDSFFDEFRDRK